MPIFARAGWHAFQTRILVILVLGMLVHTTPVAALDALSYDEPVTLRADEGLLVVSSNSGGPYSALFLESISGGHGGRIYGAEAGRTVRLVKVKAGTYRYSRLEFWEGRRFLRLTDFPLGTFDIKPGMINYPGTLQIEWFGFGRIAVSLVNQAALDIADDMANLRPAFRGLRARYAGGTPDPFLELLSDFIAAHPDAGAKQNTFKAYDYSRPDPRGLPAETLFRVDGSHDLALSPDGSLIAERRYASKAYTVNLIDPARATVTPLFETRSGEVTSIEWANDHVIVVNAITNLSSSRASVLLRLRRDAHGAVTATPEKFPQPGFVVDTLEDSEDEVMFATDTDDDKDRHRVHRVKLGEERIDARQFLSARRLDRGLEGDEAWLFDRHGNLLLAYTRKGTSRSLFCRADADARWRPCLELPLDRTFEPLRLEADGRHLIALSNIGREQVDLIRFDLETGRDLDTLYSAPGRDLIGARFRPDDDAPISVLLYQDGELATLYLDADLKELRQAMAASFPHRQVNVLEFNPSRSHALVVTSSPTQPAIFYYYDAGKHALEEVARSLPLLDDMKFREPQVFTTNTPDGFALESIITLPDGYARAPLVVMPHGGPIGVRDTLSFDRDVQFLASRGYAVLQVNYRGSGGFGSDFLSAGYGNWGKRIEDDIELALDEALRRFPLDSGRVCMVGWSYGGYSALMALARAPQRFRCAVSIAGVTDLPLMFSSSDWSSLPTTREMMKRIAGDPATELDKLKSVSPVYLAERITRPVLLIHGSADARVSLEHTARLTMMHRLRGIPTECVVLPGEDHGMSSLDGQIKTQLAIAHFLDEQIGQGLTGVDYVRKPADSTKPTDTTKPADTTTPTNPTH